MARVSCVECCPCWVTRGKPDIAHSTEEQQLQGKTVPHMEALHASAACRTGAELLCSLSSVFTSACTGFPRTWSRALAKHTRHSAVEADAHWSCTPVILLYGVVLCWPTFPCEISALWDRLSPLYSELLELGRPELGLTVTSLFVFEMCC